MTLLKSAQGDLVSTDWLAHRLGDPDVVVLDGTYFLPSLKRDAKVEFTQSRIPGAVFFDIDGVKDPESSLPHMLPGEAAFSEFASSVGISNASYVVAYDALGMMSAPRVWWTFKAFGHERVKVLDGGLPKWQREGRRIESGAAASRRRTNFVASFRSDLVRSKYEVLKVSEAAAAGARDAPQIVDARSSARFQGVEAEPRPGLASGHIPASVNLPFGSLLNADGTLLAPSEIRDRFVTAGVDLDEPFIASCGSGITACVVAFAASLVGGRASVYDGSWAEWGSDAALPIAVGRV